VKLVKLVKPDAAIARLDCACRTIGGLSASVYGGWAPPATRSAVGGSDYGASGGPSLVGVDGDAVPEKPRREMEFVVLPTVSWTTR
jgi:hypothetical protein